MMTNCDRLDEALAFWVQHPLRFGGIYLSIVFAREIILTFFHSARGEKR